ncbi:VWA domain-containing protein [Nocardia sp. NPDC057353]|uniref:vWA domain-containing protein n=1 Tax=Nocardia sp. NPDC057353 TaxID=3346104 RepID=UPI0036276CED
MTINSSTHRLAVVPASGPLTGHRIGVPEGCGSGPGLLQVSADAELLQAAVTAVELPQVPANHVAITDDLAASWEIERDAATLGWRFDPARPADVRRIVLELPTELDPGDAARDIAAAHLAGTLLWVPPDGAGFTVPVTTVPYPVREIELNGAPAGLARLTPDTKIELHASSVRAGVDIVVLADVSTSMTVDDIPADREGLRARQQWCTRLDALKQALTELLEIRLQVSGRISRLAIIEFNEAVRHKFPRGGGMAQVDGSSSEEVVTEFRQAVALLRASGATNIGNAVHEAANLLCEHGRPGNEKLIVLVSDGANWSPQGEDATGEMVVTVDEPIGLVAHLHQSLDIRLHAIGISTAEMFRRRGYQPNDSIVPDHALLAELVKVGGGDPATVGGLDVLERYFIGIGAGMTHRIQDRLGTPPAPGPLHERTVTALQGLSNSGVEWDRRRTQVRDLLMDSVLKCNIESERVFGQQVWPDDHLLVLLGREFGTPITDPKIFVVNVTDGFRCTRSEQVFSRLTEFLEQLARAGADHAAIGQLVGSAVGTPAQIQVLIMERLQLLLGALHTEMSATAPCSTPAPPAPDSRRSAWTYRD